MPPKDDVPDWQKDAGSALNKFTAKGDTRGAEDVMGAFDRHCEIENAQKDMPTKSD